MARCFDPESTISRGLPTETRAKQGPCLGPCSARRSRDNSECDPTHIAVEFGRSSGSRKTLRDNFHDPVDRNAAMLPCRMPGISQNAGPQSNERFPESPEMCAPRFAPESLQACVNAEHTGRD